MAASTIAKAAAVTAASVWLGGCATGRNPAGPVDSSGGEVAAPTFASSAPASNPLTRPGILTLVADQSQPASTGSPAVASAPFDQSDWARKRHPAYVENLFSTEYAKLFYLDAKQVFTAPMHWRTKEWLTLGALGGTVAGLTYADEAIRDFQQSKRASPSDTFAKNVAPLGYTYSAGVLGGFYVVGALWDQPRARAVAQDGLAASVITSYMIIPMMKFTFGRARPHEGHGAKEFDVFCLDQTSMPSGHTAQAFTVATVISAHYDSWWVKGAAYGAASLVGWARVQQDRHFTSDCVAGAIIGTFVGHTVTRYNRRYRAEKGERKTTFAPYYDGAAVGLAMEHKF
jgi:membrane-associated phospholipid phosphatase